MGKAAKAPDPHYRRKFVITRHAIERFRQRVDEEFAARPDGDLGNLLDERIRVSKTRQMVTDLIAGGIESELVTIENRDGTRAIAVIRDQSVITVLTEEQTENNFSRGAWKREGMNNPFREALKGVVIPTSDPGVQRIQAEPESVVVHVLSESDGRVHVLNEPPTAVAEGTPRSTPVPDIRSQLAGAGARLAHAMFDREVAARREKTAEAALVAAQMAFADAEVAVHEAKEAIERIIESAKETDQ